MHSLSDLTTTCTTTSGHVPPRLVGASTTVVGSKMYLFGGRLVSERTMVAELHIFDLKTYTWEEMQPPQPGTDSPPARYFHSADAWNNSIVIFGGMGINPNTADPEDLIVLNDVWFYDISASRWRSGAPPPGGTSRFVPRARYAHLSSVTAHTLYVIGGQDISNSWLDDVCGYDLRTNAWLSRRAYPRHCGTYRSVAVAPQLSVRRPSSSSPAFPGAPGTRFQTDGAGPSMPASAFTPSASLIHQPYSCVPAEDDPCDVYLYSNYNFTDVKRELEVFTPAVGSDAEFTISDRSSKMTGSSLPPGLRFPTGAVLGNYLILTGTYLAHTFQNYAVWALDLTTHVWHRIEPGAPLLSGSWFRSVLWADDHKLLVFGDRHGQLVEDYSRRLLCWDYVATIDLEAFGIYQPPRLVLDPPLQEMGLAALEEGALADFEIICEDGRKVKCSRRLLEDRWPWFKEQRKLYNAQAENALTTLPASTSAPSLPLVTQPSSNDPFADLATPLPGGGADGASEPEPRPDPRLTPRSFYLSEPYPITLAFVQYFYTQALVTPLQHAPAVLSQLLVLSSVYGLAHLQRLAVHAMHRALSKSTSVGVYEVSTLCACRSLQIRALKTVMAYNSKKTSRRTRRQRESENGDSDHGGPHTDGGGGHGDGYASGGGGGGPPTGFSAARPRGMSDASFMRPSNGGVSSGGHVYQQSSGAPYGRFSNYTGATGPTAPLAIRKKLSALSYDGSAAASTSDDVIDMDALLHSPEPEPPVPERRERVLRTSGDTIRSQDPRQTVSVYDAIKPLPVLPPTRSNSSMERSLRRTPVAHAVTSQYSFHLPRPRPAPLDTSEGAVTSSASSLPQSGSVVRPASTVSTSTGSTFSSMPPTPATSARGGFSPAIRSPSVFSTSLSEGDRFSLVQDGAGHVIKPPPRTSSRLGGLRASPSLGTLGGGGSPGAPLLPVAEEAGAERHKRPLRSVSNEGMAISPAPGPVYAPLPGVQTQPRRGDGGVGEWRRALPPVSVRGGG